MIPNIKVMGKRMIFQEAVNIKTDDETQIKQTVARVKGTKYMQKF